MIEIGTVDTVVVDDFRVRVGYHSKEEEWEAMVYSHLYDVVGDGPVVRGEDKTVAAAKAVSQYRSVESDE